MRILLIEDEPYWCRYVSDTLARNGNHHLVATATNLADALQAVRSVAFDLLIVDLGLPDGSGIEAIRAARRQAPEVNILVTTVFDDERSVLAAVCAGATGYILKESPVEEWVSAIESTVAGHSAINPKIARFILQALQRPARSRRLMAGLDTSGEHPTPQAVPDDPSEVLTSREVEVLRLVAKGFTLPEVGQLLHLSVTTIRTHAQSVYRKLAVSTRGEAIFEANRLGIV